jgi:MFS family permease
LPSSKIRWFDGWWGRFRIAWSMRDQVVPAYGYFHLRAGPAYDRSDSPASTLSSYDDNVTTAVAEAQESTHLAIAEPWRERLFVPTLVTIGLVMAMMSSLGAPLVPTIAKANDVSLGTGQWLLTATLLSGAIAAPIMGQLADGRHRRLVILCALVIVMIGCIIAAAVNNFVILILARGLQGLGLGLVAVAMVMARRHLPAKRSASVIGVLSITAATGVGIGYPLTGLIAQSFDYHVAFWVGAGVVAASFVLAFVVLPTDRSGPPSHLDYPGAALFGLALGALLTAVSEGGVWGWDAPVNLALFAVAVALGFAFVRYELRVRQPLVVLRQLRIPVVVATNTVGAFIGVSMYLFMPIIVEFVQAPRSTGYGFGASVVVAGLCLVPLSAGTALATPLVRIVRDRYGPRVTLIAAQVVFIAAMLFFAFRHAALWEAFVTMGLGGIAIGLSFGTMPGFIVAAVAPTEVGSAMGLYQVIRSIGLTVGSASSAAILAAHTGANQILPSVDGYRDALLAAAGICVLLIPVCLLFPAHSRAVAGGAAAVEEAEEIEEAEEEAAGVDASVPAPAISLNTGGSPTAAPSVGRR